MVCTSALGRAAAWTSATDTDPDYEVDVYAGFTGGAEDGFGWDVGIVYYTYRPEEDTGSLDYPEVYFGRKLRLL